MEQNSTNDNILQMVEVLIEFKLDMETIFNSDFHFHLGLGLCLLHITVVMHDCKVNLFGYSGFHVSVDRRSDEISDPACNTIECFVFFFKVWKLELKLFVFS